MQLSQLGLQLGSFLGHAYLIPFKNTKENKTDVQLIVGYKGLYDLARRSGKLITVLAEVVYEGEPFNLELGLNPVMTHSPLPPSKRSNQIIGAYAVAELKDGGKQFQFMWKEDIDAIANKAKIKSKISPWHEHYPAMAKKTVLRSLAKLLPMSAEFYQAAAMDEENTQVSFA
ncbi:DNA single-strand annealing protein RecT, partial [Candidatus Magnetobacterium bavaricum]